MNSYIEQLEKFSEPEPVSAVYYFDDQVPSEDSYCGDCAYWLIDLARSKLTIDCVALLNYPILAQRYYQYHKEWLSVDLCGGSYILPSRILDIESDGMECCARCNKMLSYSLTEYGVKSEIEHFESIELDGISPRVAYNYCNYSFLSQEWAEIWKIEQKP